MQIDEVTERLCIIQVITGRECVWNDSKELTIWPRETFLHQITSTSEEWEIDLDSYIARWVTPHVTCIDNIIAAAGIKRSIKGAINTNSDDEKLKEINAIYDEISKDIHYVSRSFSYIDSGKGQRISLPSTTIKHKSGNCIDMTVLLASCLEALRYDICVMLVPGHAFLKILFSENYSEYVETTYMGKHNFAKAIEIGRKEYEYHSDNKRKQCLKEINIKVSRKAGIMPME